MFVEVYQQVVCHFVWASYRCQCIAVSYVGNSPMALALNRSTYIRLSMVMVL